MNETTGTETRRILSGEIKDKLDDVKKLSFCILDQSQGIRDFFLGEPPKIAAKDSRPRDGGGYFGQIKNDLDDVYGYLRGAMDVLIVVGKEIGVDIDRSKISERLEPRTKSL